MPTGDPYGAWPQSGEIDVVEIKGNPSLISNGEEIGNRRMGSTLHWGPVGDNSAWRKTHAERLLWNGSFSANFHTYTFDWSTEGFTFYVDDTLLGEMPTPQEGYWDFGGFEEANPWLNGSANAPFDQEFHFILNVACGGTFFPDNSVSGNYTKPWENDQPDMMRRFWESRELWLDSWKSEDNAMKVDYIRVYSFDPV